MDDDLKFWLKLWQTMIISIVIMVLGLMAIDSINIKRFVDNGYTRETLPGTAMVQWVKK